MNVGGFRNGIENKAYGTYLPSQHLGNGSRKIASSGQPGLHSEFEARLDYIASPVLKKNRVHHQ
jgi:hypothetical protein